MCLTKTEFEFLGHGVKITLFEPIPKREYNPRVGVRTIKRRRRVSI